MIYLSRMMYYLAQIITLFGIVERILRVVANGLESIRTIADESRNK